ncbi:MAG: pilin [Candidatus Taylorbacteria bacterium]|nr:pilin [Candidatus Taylorbacteria bacterium]
MKFRNKILSKIFIITLSLIFTFSLFSSVTVVSAVGPSGTPAAPIDTPVSPADRPDATADTPNNTTNPCDPNVPSGKLCNPLGNKSGDNDIFKLVATIVDLALTIASIAVVLYLIYIGFQYVMALGNENELKKLHETLIWTFVGIAIIFGAKLIVAILQNTINALK